MATIRKVGDKWRVEVRRKGVNKSGNFPTKGEARAWAANVERRILGGAKEYSKDITFEFAAHRYLKEVSNQKKGARWESIRVYKFLKAGMGKLTLSEMHPKYWRNWIAEQMFDLSPASINRELNLISAILTQCVEWEYLETNPLHGVRRPKNPRHRDRRITEHEVEFITGNLGLDRATSSGQTAIAFLLALETGMRRGELTSLALSDIDLVDRVATVVDSKNGDKRGVPLTTRAVELFEMLDGVFTVSPDVLSKLFKRACDRCQIHNLRFHDARHEAATRLARKIDVLDLARMLGHRDVRSLMIYYNPTASEIAKRLD